MTRRIATVEIVRPPDAPVRTVLLAAIAAALAIVWLARNFEIETGELTGFFLMSLGVVAGIVVFAALTVSIAKMFSRRRGQGRSTKNRRTRGA